MGGIISFIIEVPNIDEILNLYDHIQVHRAPVVDGTYVDITSPQATPASISGSIAGPWNLNGLSLSLILNSADPVVIPFTGTNPLILQSVLDKINAVVPDLASVSAPSSNKVKLTSALVGNGSSILASGSALSVLGLPSTKVNGKGTTLLLVQPTTFYKFTDFDGTATLYYKTRFFSSLTGRVSDFSAPRQGDTAPVLDDGVLSLAVINLVSVQGNPIVGRRIIFVPMINMAVPESSFYTLPGFDRAFAVTDNRGHAEISLVVGMKLRVFVEGSQFFRDITVPAESPFDLLALMADSPDPFSIVQAPARPIRVT